VQLLDMEGSAIKLDDANSKRRLKFTAKDEIELRRQRGLINRIGWLFAKNSVIWGPLMIWLARAIWRHGLVSFNAAVPGIALVIFLLGFAWAIVPAVLYDRALEASIWCRWSEVLRIMDWLARWKKWFRTPFPEHELLFRAAAAEAGLGRLDAGLARVAPLEHDASLRPGFYAARKASIYAAARDFQHAALCQHEARKANPSPATTIDLATTLARRLCNTRAAAKLLDEIDVSRLAPAAQIFAFYTRGVIACDESNPTAALDWLTRSLEMAKTNPGSPLMQGIILDGRAHRALALAALGDKAAARADFAAARPMLEARRDTAMIAQCEAALAATR
jgi:hypothetical protein